MFVSTLDEDEFLRVEFGQDDDPFFAGISCTKFLKQIVPRWFTWTQLSS